MAEMIAVVVLTECVQDLLRLSARLDCHFLDTCLEIRLQLLRSDAADGGEAGIERYVLEIVEVGEDRHLAESGDACQHGEMYVAVAALEHAEESAEYISVGVLKLLVVD